MLFKLYSALGAAQNAISPQTGTVGYWEKQALGAMGAKGYRIATVDKDSEILGQIQNIYNLENMDHIPKLILYDQEIPNAAFIHTGTIIVSTGLLKVLDKDEREAVLAHEIIHQKQNRTNLASFAAYAGATVGATTLATNKIFSALPKRFNGSFVNYLTFGAVGYVVNLVTSVPYFSHKRHQELKADEGAANITRKPHKLKSALLKMEQFAKEKHANKAVIPHTDGNPSLSTMHEARDEKPSRWKRLKTELYSSHPSTKVRVEQLDDIEFQQQRAGILDKDSRTVKGSHTAKVIDMAEYQKSSSQERA